MKPNLYTSIPPTDEKYGLEFTLGLERYEDLLTMAKIIDRLDQGWLTHFEQEFSQPYMDELRQLLKSELGKGRVVYPAKEDWFNAFVVTPFNNIKVVIVGQDPYHGPGQAHGLSFSVPDGVAFPPSLKNIFQEIHRDLGISMPETGNLVPWAQQGVLLLNSVLTVVQGMAGSHGGKGWEIFTNSCIQYINAHKEHVVFMAWGKFAHGVCDQVDRQKHLVIKTSHPSPLGAHRSGRDFDAFMGSGCFSKANSWLRAEGVEPIDWHLSNLVSV